MDEERRRGKGRVTLSPPIFRLMWRRVVATNSGWCGIFDQRGQTQSWFNALYTRQEAENVSKSQQRSSAADALTHSIVTGCRV